MSPVSSAIGMNASGNTSPPLRVPPSNQGFDALDHAAFQVEQRLIEDLELLLPDRLVQIRLQAKTLEGPGGSWKGGQVRGGEELVAVPPHRLGPIHGDVGMFDQDLRIFSIRRKELAPTLTVTKTSRPFSRKGCCIASRTFLATWPASSTRQISERRIRNSSPPSLGHGVAGSYGPNQPLTYQAQKPIPHSMSQAVVQDSLKRSRSRKSKPSCRPDHRACNTARSRRSRSRAWLGSPVIPSW